MLSHIPLCYPMDYSPPAPLRMAFSRQECWSRLPCPSLGDLPDPRIKPMSPVSPALQVDSLLLNHPGSLYMYICSIDYIYMYIYSIYMCNIYIYTHTHIQYTMVGWGTYSHQGKTSFTVYHRLCCIYWKRYKWRDEYYNAYKYWVL